MNWRKINLRHMYMQQRWFTTRWFMSQWSRKIARITRNAQICEITCRVWREKTGDRQTHRHITELANLYFVVPTITAIKSALLGSHAAIFKYSFLHEGDFYFEISSIFKKKETHIYINIILSVSLFVATESLKVQSTIRIELLLLLLNLENGSLLNCQLEK